MMLDFKDFSGISRSLTPEGLIAKLDYCFKNFDRITAIYRLEKIKTMGDGYLCVGGVPKSNQTHPFDCIEAAYEMLTFLEEWKTEQMSLNELYFEARIGIHSGPVIAGVVGDKKFAFDLWGDAVNIAARLESSGETGKINISQTTYDLVKHKIACTHRGKIPIKNQEPINMYFVKE
jgi:class 3 adenylate cyclase